MESKFLSFSCSTEVNKILSQKSIDSLNPINYYQIDNKKNKSLSASQSRDITQNVSIVETIEESNSSDKSVRNSSGVSHRRQILILILLFYGNFWVAACVSLQAPFFPKQAESKGATPTQYGFVFGIYELVIAITSPLFGKMIAKISPVFLCEIGLFVSGFSTVMFGLLDRAPFGTPFIVLCFVVRIIEGISAAAFMTSSYVIMAKEFPDKIAATFSLLETAFGLGLILGPTLGGAFFQLGGFILPFVILGIFLLSGGVFTFILMPNSIENTIQKSGNIWKFVSDPGILLDALAIATSLNFIGFNSATLEPHLRQFDLKPVIMGCVFIISGGIYAITTPIWGKLCDKGFDPKKLCLLGSVLCLIGFTFIGPLDFIPIEPELWIIVVSLVFIGLGMAAKLVTAFISSLHDSIHRRGFPDDISTYGLVSAMFFCACSIGAFIGPTLGGFLLDTIGYRKGLIVIYITDLVMILLLLVYLTVKRIKTTNRDELQPLISRQNKP